MSLAKTAVAATSGYIVPAQGGGVESDLLRNKPAAVPVKLHGDTPPGIPKRSRPQKRAGLDKESMTSGKDFLKSDVKKLYKATHHAPFIRRADGDTARRLRKLKPEAGYFPTFKKALSKSAADEFGFGKYPGPSTEIRTKAAPKAPRLKKTPDEASAEVAYFEGLTGTLHPKRVKRSKQLKKMRRRASSNSNSFSRVMSPENVVANPGGSSGQA